LAISSFLNMSARGSIAWRCAPRRQGLAACGRSGAPVGDQQFF
jgi:hypothetical protein